MSSEGSRRSLLLVFVSAILIAAFSGLFDAAAFAATVPVPSQLLLSVRETAGIARNGEVVRSGVPIPRSLNLLDAGRLAIVSSSGTAVPAEFEVTARWNAGKKDTTAPIQWLLVTFPASVGANQTATYRVVTDGSVANPAPATRINLTQSGNAITVDTGAAVFHLGASSGALFDEVDLANGTRLIGGGALSIQTGGSTYGHSTTRKITIEHQGPLTAIVVVQGAYDAPAIGGGQVSTRRRYVFTAGSPTAVVRHVADWEGNLYPGCIGCVTTTAGAPNGVRIDKLRDDLAIDLGGTPNVLAVGNFGAPAVSGAVPSSQSAWVRQQLRPSRTSPLAFDVNVAGVTAAGAKADGALLAASGPAGTVAIALNHMHRYEPQALRLLAGGHLAVDLLDDKSWLANHQGLFATLAVTAEAGTPSRDDLNRTTWAPLNRPLHAWAQPEWFAASEAVDEFPTGPLPTELASYDTLVSGVIDRTVQKIDEVGLNGMMTFGVYPRYWAVDGPGEVDCAPDGSGDPTPNEPWDNLFWCGTWTDYHDTVATVPYWVMRTGDVELLDELAFPGALRTLHTQIMQCSPTENWFYCGQAPAGYGAYRTDFNSSHAYFDNLYLYYWLTGDDTVIDIVRRGAENMRRWMCDTRGPTITDPTGPGGPACSATAPININARPTGRVGIQWQTAFRFMGLASDDPSFLEDYVSGLARAVTQQYTELSRNGILYGLWGGPDLMTTPGTYENDQSWQTGFYDADLLYRLQVDTNDAPIGVPAMRPSDVFASLARGMKDLQATVYGDGSVGGRWPDYLSYAWLSGGRIGGTLGSFSPVDRDLYPNEKGGMAQLFVRAGQQTGDAALLDYGRQMTLYMLDSSIHDGAPLGKLQGQNLTRLHSAVARLAAGGGSTPAPPPTGPTAPAAPTALAAQAASSSAINLAWTDNSSNEDSFRVEQLVNGAFQEIRNLAAGTTTVQVTGLAASTAYSFRVRAVNSAGASAYSNTASVTTQAPPPPPPSGPAAPSGLTAQAASSSAVNLAWTDNSSDETSFRVEQLINGVYQEVQVLTTNTTRVQIIGLAASTTYSFRVRAANANGFSAYSNVASAATLGATSGVPAAPASLTGWAASPTEVVLNWLDNSTNETAFRVERQVNGAYQEVMTVGANITSARVSGLAAGTANSFRVRASNAAGYSGYSNVASVTTPAYATAPAAPTGLTGKGVSATEIQLTWADNSNNEVSFRIEKKNGNYYQEVTAVAANVNTVKVGGLTASTSYSFRVRAANSAGFSAYSNVATAATTSATPPPTTTLAAPTISSILWLGGGNVQVTWRDNSSTETQFVVERMVNGVYQAAVTVGANVTTAKVTGLKTHASYTFRVKVADAAGHVAYSSPANVNTF